MEEFMQLMEPFWDTLTVNKIEETKEEVVYTYLIDNYDKDTAGI